MAERCPRCKDRISTGDIIVECPNCKKQYHKWCWGFVEKCSDCGYENAEAINVSNINNNKQPNGTSQQETKTAKDYINTAVSYAQENINNTIHSEEIGMFSNVGDKLKSWAKTHFITSVVLGVIIFITTCTFGDDYILVGFLAGLTEIFVAWAFALILYAFGELVQNSKESKDIQQKILDELKDKKE